MAQRQWRSDDTDKWKYGFGNGQDGDLVISANTTDAPIDSTCSGMAGATTLSATNASFATGQAVLIHQTRGTGAGNWELNYIDGYTAGTITLKHVLCNTYQNGSGANQAQVIVLKQYKSVTVNSGATWTAKSWNGSVGGILAFLCKGTVTVNGTINATGRGFRGGTSREYIGNCGEGSVGDRSQTTGSNGSGGGGGTGSNHGTDEKPHANGGGGGNGTNGSTGGRGSGHTGGTGGSSTGTASLVLACLGGAGGASATVNANGWWTRPGYMNGANGGGFILLIAKTLNVTGSLINNGNNSNSLVDGRMGYGGSGAGGSILIKAQAAGLGDNLTKADRGTVGTYGGYGRIHLDYSGEYTGTTTPALDASLDPSIKGGALGMIQAMQMLMMQ